MLPVVITRTAASDNTWLAPAGQEYSLLRVFDNRPAVQSELQPRVLHMTAMPCVRPSSSSRSRRRVGLLSASTPSPLIFWKPQNFPLWASTSTSMLSFAGDQTEHHAPRFVFQSQLHGNLVLPWWHKRDKDTGPTGGRGDQVGVVKSPIAQHHVAVLQLQKLQQIHGLGGDGRPPVGSRRDFLLGRRRTGRGGLCRAVSGCRPLLNRATVARPKISSAASPAAIHLPPGLRRRGMWPGTGTRSVVLGLRIPNGFLHGRPIGVGP